MRSPAKEIAAVKKSPVRSSVGKVAKEIVGNGSHQRGESIMRSSERSADSSVGNEMYVFKIISLWLLHVLNEVRKVGR